MKYVFGALVLFLCAWAWAHKKGGIMLGSGDLMQIISRSAAVVVFHGQGWGSFKTLTAVWVSWLLLKSGKFERVYANIPVSFATSPPENIKQENFDFLAPYAKNSIFIIDEGWSKFAQYRSETLEEILAYPRKRNQRFLITSVIPLANFTAYAKLVISKKHNFQATFGLPFVWMQAWKIPKSAKDKPLGFLLFPPSAFFSKYSTRFQPPNHLPIQQFRDTGAMYDEESRLIPSEIRHLYNFNSWGEAIPKKNLSPEEQGQIDRYFPKFDIQWSEPEDLPKAKTIYKWYQFQNYLGTEFNPSFVVKFAILGWIMFCMSVYGLGYHQKNPPITKNLDYFIMAIPPGDWEKSRDAGRGFTTEIMRIYNEAKSTAETTKPTTTDPGPGPKPTPGLEPVQFSTTE